MAGGLAAFSASPFIEQIMTGVDFHPAAQFPPISAGAAAVCERVALLDGNQPLLIQLKPLARRHGD